jgi:hypothetical protein
MLLADAHGPLGKIVKATDSWPPDYKWVQRVRDMGTKPILLISRLLRCLRTSTPVTQAPAITASHQKPRRYTDTCTYAY